VNTAFTICSNNFLGQAKTMFDSLRKFHPEIQTFLFIVDEPAEGIDYSFFLPAEVIFVNGAIAEGFNDMLARYNIIELNTAVRPHIIQYMAKQYPQVEKLLYVDPDIFIYGSLEDALKRLDHCELLITPHFLKPVPLDGMVPFENLALNYGTFNMGFFGLKPHSANMQSFLKWWQRRTSLFGHIDPANGYFTDQIWFNLAPIFFQNVEAYRHSGYNMAAWNLHERVIDKYADDGNILLENGEQLVAYHFSSWNYNEPETLSRVYNRYSFENRPDLVRLYEDYRRLLKANRMDELQTFSCTLPYYRNIARRSRVKQALSPGVNLMRYIWRKI
jgi:hypothetical protein